MKTIAKIRTNFMAEKEHSSLENNSNNWPSIKTPYSWTDLDYSD